MAAIDAEIEDEASRRAYERYRAVRFFGSLNGLRFVCIVAVMWHHSPARTAMDEPVALLLRGFVGVDFFFVLSGYLITTLLLREEARKGRFSLVGFYRRRVLRIVPVYFLVVSAVSLYYVVLAGRDNLAPLVPYYYLFLSNFLISDIPLLTITWSLAVEEQYYLMWPLMLLLLPQAGRWRVVVVSALVAFCVGSAAGLFAGIGPGPIRTEHAIWALPATGYSAILIGTLAAILLHNRAGFAVFYRLCGGRFAALALFAALAVALQTLPGVLTGWPNLVMHSLMMLCLVSLVVREDNALAGVFQWRPVARIGEISYGLYLYHLIGRHFGVEASGLIDLPIVALPWVQTALFLVASIAIAEISFRYFESVFLRLK